MPDILERIVINTGPLIALERMGAMDLPLEMDVEFLAPKAVILELEAGSLAGHSSLKPPWLKIKELKSALSPMVLSVLDIGEASVIQLAIERSIRRVCIDELKGRRSE